MLSTNFTNTKKQIETTLGNFLKNYGFEREKIFTLPSGPLYGFVRKDKFCNKQIIYMSFYNYKTQYGIEVFTKIHIKNIADFFRNEVNSQYDENIGILSPELGGLIAHKDTGTNLGGSRNKKVYYIENDSEIKKLSVLLSEQIQKYVFPYFDENSSLEKMEKLLNANIEEVSLHHFFSVTKACFGIIIARILDRPNLQELIKQYRDDLRPAKQEFLNEYEKVVSLVSQPSFSLSAEIDFPPLLKNKTLESDKIKKNDANIFHQWIKYFFK